MRILHLSHAACEPGLITKHAVFVYNNALQWWISLEYDIVQVQTFAIAVSGFSQRANLVNNDLT